MEQGKKIFLISTLSTGKVKTETHFVQVTASVWIESHMFLRSLNRGLNYIGRFDFVISEKKIIYVLYFRSHG